MAFINPELKRFSDENLRARCNEVARLFYALEKTVDLYAAGDFASHLDDKIDPSEKLDDGSDVDGRLPATPENIKATMGFFTDFVAQMRANDSANLKLILSLATNFGS